MIADEIRKIYQADPGNAESAIEIQLHRACSGMADDEKRAFLTSLANDFKTQSNSANQGRLETGLPEDVISLLLGKAVVTSDIPTHEMIEKLSVALNTLFSSLNRIVQTIDATLMVDEPGSQTIRSLIGSQMDESLEEQSIDDYLGRIEKAFLVTHTAFRQAAHTIFNRILEELNPDAIASASESRLKFGPLRKAALFDIFDTRFATLKNWFESGRFMKDFLREFENNIQTSP